MEVPLDLEHRARLGHGLGIQDDVCVNPGGLLAKLLVGHGHGADRPHGAGGRQAPADLAGGAVDVVLQVDHGLDHAVGRSRPVLEHVAEHHVREILVLVRRWAVVQLVRAHPEGHIHLGDDRLLGLGRASGQGCDVHLVLHVDLDHTAVGQLHDPYLHPAPVPDLEQAHAAVLGVAPLLFLDRPVLLVVVAGGVVRRHTAVGRDLVLISPAAVPTHDEFGLAGAHQRNQRGIRPAPAHQVARLGQHGVLVQHVPPDFVAVHHVGAVLELEWILLAGDLDPADTYRGLGQECVRARLVGLGMALGLVQLEVQRRGHVVAVLVAVGRDAPVCALAGLVAGHGNDGGTDQRFDGRRHAELLHALEDYAVKLVAVDVVHPLVGLRAPGGLVADLVEPGGVERQAQALGAGLSAHACAGGHGCRADGVDCCCHGGP